MDDRNLLNARRTDAKTRGERVEILKIFYSDQAPLTREFPEFAGLPQALSDLSASPRTRKSSWSALGNWGVVDQAGRSVVIRRTRVRSGEWSRVS